MMVILGKTFWNFFFPSIQIRILTNRSIQQPSVSCSGILQIKWIANDADFTFDPTSLFE